jgi:hypothetical protein
LPRRGSRVQIPFPAPYLRNRRETTPGFTPDAAHQSGFFAVTVTLQCVYCGRKELRLTKDHVPPKCLFLRPRPQLITVPACHGCNDSFKLDYEYFRIAVTAEAAYRDETATELWSNRIAPRMGQGLRRTLLANMRPVEMRSSAGLIQERAIGIPYERRRIDRVVERIVRGLLWHHYHSRPAAVRFEVFYKPDLQPIQDLLCSIAFNSIGGNAIRYRHSVTMEDPNSSIWGLQFYRHIHFLVLVLSDSFTEESTVEVSAHSV